MSSELWAGTEILPEGSRAGLGGRTTPAGHHVLQWVFTAESCAWFVLVVHNVSWPPVIAVPVSFLSVCLNIVTESEDLNNLSFTGPSSHHFHFCCWLEYFFSPPFSVCLSLLPVVLQMALAWSVITSRHLNSSTWPHRLATSWLSTTWPRCMLLVLVWCAPATLLWRWGTLFHPDCDDIVRHCRPSFLVCHTVCLYLRCSFSRTCVNVVAGQIVSWRPTAALRRVRQTLRWFSICCWLSKATRWPRATWPSFWTRVRKTGTLVSCQGGKKVCLSEKHIRSKCHETVRVYIRLNVSISKLFNHGWLTSW